MEKQRIVDIALNHLKEAIGLAYRYEFLHQKTGKTLFDCKVVLDFDGKDREYFCIVRKEIREHQIAKLQELVTDKTLLIAERIYPKMKTLLKAFNINFLDMQGNIYLKDNGVFLYIDQQQKKTEQAKTNNLFTPAGLKVVFNILLKPALINQTYREIAGETGVALDTINKTFTTLEQKKYLLRIDNKKRKLQNKKKLLDNWITNYNDVLREKLFLGRYRFANHKNEWHQLKLNTPQTQWGGEPAANILTNYIQTGEFYIYTQEEVPGVMKQLGIVPDQAGNILLYKKFWTNHDQQNIVPAILVYADLLNTGEPRNLETANILYNETIKDKFE